MPKASAAIAPLKPSVSTIPNITKTKAGVVNMAFLMTWILLSNIDQMRAPTIPKIIATKKEAISLPDTEAMSTAYGKATVAWCRP